MIRLTIEELTKPMKKDGVRKASFKTDLLPFAVDLDRLTMKVAGIKIALERIDGTRGGDRYFFLCPECGKRCRVLYSHIGLFWSCGACSGRMKKTLNRTKSRPSYFFGLALRECRKIVPDYIPPNWLCLTFPERPKYMKRNKYYKHLQRFLNYSRKGNELWLGQLKNLKT